MMKYPKPILYKSPLDLPEGQSGKFKITHGKLVGKVAVLSLREAFTTGRRPTFVNLSEPLKIHQLEEEDQGVWMTDHPLELRQAAEWLRSTPIGIGGGGRVLVGGLGLGLVVSWLAEYGCEVTVVERSSDVNRLVWPWVMNKVKPPQKMTLVCDDIHEYLKTIPAWDFDHAFLDTWQGTNEATWWEDVFPQRRVIANRFGKQRVHCWAEDMMLGQIAQSLFMANPSVQKQLMPNGQVLPRGWYYHGFGFRELTRREIANFLRNVGLPAWEKKWGPIVADGIAHVKGEAA